MADPHQQAQGTAGARGEQVHLHVGRTPGGGVTAFASSVSTGGGGRTQAVYETQRFSTPGARRGGGSRRRAAGRRAAASGDSVVLPRDPRTHPCTGGATTAFDTMPVRELKEWLAARGVDVSDCLERGDLVARCKHVYANR